MKGFNRQTKKLIYKFDIQNHKNLNYKTNILS